MKATDVLKEEHRVIERVLTALEQGINRLDAGKPLRAGFFQDAVTFFKGFADGCHHLKEEKVLFAQMAERGLPVEDGPIGVMLSEHETGRGYIQAILQAADRFEAGEDDAKSSLVENGRSYINLLAQHIMKEDQILFPIADRVIPVEAHDMVWEGFESVEHKETGEGVHEKYLQLAQALENEASSNGSTHENLSH